MREERPMSAHAAINIASEVERMLQEDHSFELVEEFIDRQLISEEQKAALWLLAWAETDAGTRRRLLTPILTG
jgi:hypothetical protein